MSRFDRSFLGLSIASGKIWELGMNVPYLPLALGASKTVAQTAGLITAGQWLSIGLKGASLGPATFTALETGILVGVNSLYATAMVGLSYEAGVGVGSILSALIFPCEEEVCPSSGGGP